MRQSQRLIRSPFPDLAPQFVGFSLTPMVQPAASLVVDAFKVIVDVLENEPELRSLSEDSMSPWTAVRM